MADDLDGCREKLDRAKEHMEALEAQYPDPKKPTELVTYDQWELFPDGHRWRVTYLGEQELWKPPRAWGLVVGDAVHNMRSALDHLACRLVERGTPPPDMRAISFPIWDDDPRGNQKKLATYRARVKGMRTADDDGVWKLQPFHDPTAPASRMLIDLALLDNTDKHQLCLPSLAVVGEHMHLVTWASQIGGTEPDEGEMQINEGAPLKPHSALARIRAFSGTEAIFFNIGVRSKIVYGGEGSVVGLGELREIHAHCVGIVESFAPRGA